MKLEHFKLGSEVDYHLCTVTFWFIEGNQWHKPLNSLFDVSAWSLTRSSANQTDSICPNNTARPVIRVSVAECQPPAAARWQASSHHYAPLLFLMKSTASPPLLSAAWLIKWSNMWITQGSIIKSLSCSPPPPPPPPPPQKPNADTQSHLGLVLLLCMLRRSWLRLKQFISEPILAFY